MRAFSVRNMPIAHKMAGMLALISGVSLLLSGAALVGQEFVTFRSATIDELSAIADVVGSNCGAALLFRDPAAASATLAALRAERHVIAAGVYRNDGSLFARYLRNGDETRLLPTVPRTGGAYFDGRDVLVFRAIAVDKEDLGTILVRSDMQIV